MRDRESRIRRYIADLRDMAAISEAAFLENRERQYAVLHALQLAIEASVDFATHLRRRRPGNSRLLRRGV